MYLIFDCSATRKPSSYDAPYSDLFNWPRLLHLSWILLDENLKLIEDHNAIIKPDGYIVSDEILDKVHISREDSDNGKDIKSVLSLFNETIKKATYGFAHNLQFNETVISAAFYRHKIESSLSEVDQYCLMQEATYYCRIPSKIGGYKWPSLQELHEKLYQQRYTPSNNARADVVIAAKCFIKLKGLHMLDDIFE